MYLIDTFIFVQYTRVNLLVNGELEIPKQFSVFCVTESEELAERRLFIYGSVHTTLKNSRIQTTTFFIVTLHETIHLNFFLLVCVICSRVLYSQGIVIFVPFITFSQSVLFISCRLFYLLLKPWDRSFSTRGWRSTQGTVK